MIKSMSGSVAATWLSIAHMSARIFSCRGPRMAALLKIVQHHGEIPLVLVSPSWEGSKGKRMPGSGECQGIQNPSRVISHYFHHATECLVCRLVSIWIWDKNQRTVGLASPTVMIFLRGPFAWETWALRRFQKCCFFCKTFNNFLLLDNWEPCEFGR